MSYVQRVLQPGETVRHTASIHWIVYLPGALVLLLRACGLRLWRVLQPAALDVLADWAAGLCGRRRPCICLIREWFGWWTTEIAVTNRRVIYKTGFIQRTTNRDEHGQGRERAGRPVDPRPDPRLRRRDHHRNRRRLGSALGSSRSRSNCATTSPASRTVTMAKAPAISASRARSPPRPNRRCSTACRIRTPTPTTSRASRRPSSPRSARSPASRISRIS